MITPDLITGNAPPGSTVTLQLDVNGDLIAFYVRSPDPAARTLFGRPS